MLRHSIRQSFSADTTLAGHAELAFCLNFLNGVESANEHPS